MEVYAAFAEYCDSEIGRVFEALKEMGQFDNTLIFYIIGDNGTSAEGGANGMFNEYTYFNGVQETVADMLKHYDEWGSPSTYPHMAAGWAVAGDTPFMWTKRIPVQLRRHAQPLDRLLAQTHHRNQRSPLAVAPRHRCRSHRPRSRPPPRTNLRQRSRASSSKVSACSTPLKAPRREHTQNPVLRDHRQPRRLQRRLVRRHHPPRALGIPPRTTLQNDKWELYDTRNDFSLTNDLAASNPAKLKVLQDLFIQEAIKYRVLPIDDRSLERFNAALVGRPDLMAGRTSLTLSSGMIGMSENVFINIKNRSFSITADLDIPQGGANGVIVAQGGRFGGWSLYLKDGKPAFCYNFLGLIPYKVAAPSALAPGKSTVRMDFAYDGGGLGKGGTATLLVNGSKVASGRIDHTQAMVFSADDPADVGIDDGTNVTDDYKEGDNAFTGEILKVVVDVQPVGASQKQEEDKTRQEAAVKKALSD